MNKIIQPVTTDGMVGFDEFGQLCAWEQDGECRRGWRIGDVREERCVVCGRGWELTSASLKDQFFLDHRRAWAHESCYKRHLALSEHTFWHGAVCDARIRFDGLKETENEYRGAWNLPWYRAALLDRNASLKMGRRKRVHHMEIELRGETRYDRAKAEKFLAGEAVTKGMSAAGLYLHAWTEAKAREYLTAFADILGLPEKRA